MRRKSEPKTGRCFSVSSAKDGKKSILQLVEVKQDGLGAIIVKHLYTKDEASNEDLPGFSPLYGLVRHVRSSGSGDSCDKSIYLSMIGKQAQFPQRALRIFRFGHALEPVIAGFLKEDGWDVHYNGDTTTGLVVPLENGIVTGHPDVIARHPVKSGNKWALLDIKTMNDKQYTKWTEKKTKSAKPEYYTQVNLYGEGFGLGVSGIVGCNKNTSEYSDEEFPTDIAHNKETVARLETLFAMDAYEKLRYEPAWKCPYCSHKESCFAPGGMPKNEIPRLVSRDRCIDLLAHAFTLVDRNGVVVEPKYEMREIVTTDPVKKNFGIVVPKTIDLFESFRETETEPERERALFDEPEERSGTEEFAELLAGKPEISESLEDKLEKMKESMLSEFAKPEAPETGKKAKKVPVKRGRKKKAELPEPSQSEEEAPAEVFSL